ncbi:MAG TPA: hypothetical protein VFD70_02955 [Anaerolineae bacterium]|nr:hypothetical protein [Anaerolineae bacterium]
MLLSLLPSLLYITGTFALVLGILHFFFPILFDFRGAIPEQGSPLKPFPLMLTRYQTVRQDIYGLIWVMNHIASFALVTVGLLDLFWTVWLRSTYGALIAAWIALFYFLRAGTQLYMGRRRGDWIILAAFGALGVFHLLVIFIS